MKIINQSLDIKREIFNQNEIKFMSEGIKRKMIDKETPIISPKKIKFCKEPKKIKMGGLELPLLILPKSQNKIKTNEEFEKMVKKEYKEISKETPFDTFKMNFDQKKKKFPTACNYENWKKNRYCDVLCNEETRFIFKTQNVFKNSLENITLDMNPFLEEVMDDKKYINANYIKGNHKSSSTFIATQAPLEDTFPEFYEMIWQAESNIIITLTSINEGGKTKMNKFWPEKDQPISVSHFSISLEEEATKNNGLTFRKICLSNLSTSNKRFIYQIHFTGWPDNGVPKEPSSLIEIYKFHKYFKSLGSKDGLNGPAVVHCSAGIGRTATYMSFVFGAEIIESLRRTGISFDQNLLTSQINLPQLVINIRKQRSGSIQTWEQYGLVYKALNYYLSNNSN
eukprot:TRINITY_DN7321_c0_g1_i1.p1 TRINITY_DN7321_c0_g1~~TRINITY_DN7321_c0_g1_i1.p1  ORF type:complete len:396 (-),score=114.61 TRINITY_DN7321_c0_g1_i1:3-1190(-)